MPATSQRPLLTQSIGAYNHEQFIRQAIQGAFSQTYSPLQIVLSDDCSRDRTFEIMREMAAAYRGPHEVILNRNSRNLGIAGHVNRVVEISRGELLILSAGDDISVPDRVQAAWEAWEASGRNAFGVHSRVTDIDASHQFDPGNVPAVVPAQSRHIQDGAASIKGYLQSGKPVVLGCTGAWSRALFEKFGPLPDNVVYEDMALTWRSLLSGGLVFVDHPLVLYRLHGTNIHHSSPEYVVTWNDLNADEERAKTALRRKLVMAKSFRADLEKAKSLKMLGEPEYVALLDEVAAFERTNAWELNYRESRLPRRLALFLNRPESARRSGPASERHIYRLLPNWFYYSGRILKNRLRSRMTPAGQ